jgi:general secretion pathway protein D
MNRHWASRRRRRGADFQHREKNMKLSVLTLGLLAALPLVAGAQDSKSSASRDGMEIVDLITRFANRTNTDFVIDPRVRAQVPLAGIELNDLTFDQLLVILDVHQFAVLKSAGLHVVLPDAAARQFPTPVYNDARFKAADYEIITLLVQPKNVCAGFMVPVLRPLMPQAAHLAAEIQTNTLIINDRAVNARRIVELVDQLDKRGSGKKDCPNPGAVMSPPPAAPAKPAG